MNVRPRFASLALAAGISVVAPPSRGAEVLPLVRIGDIDGFGYGEASGFRAARGGGFANRDQLGVPTAGDVLPDINRDGGLSTGSRDNFDFRNDVERSGVSVFAGSGVVSTLGTSGSQYTDISLSTSYDQSQAAGQVLVGGDPNSGLVFGSGGQFPSPPSSSLPNQPGFLFNFDVEKSALAAGQSIYFNLVFGDYDVTPASIRITKADGATRVIGLQQQNNARNDGLIQAATAVLDFSDVFRDGGSNWLGTLLIDFRAPNEPYTAFDYVELSTTALVPAVPEPSSIVMAGLGALAIATASRRRGR